MTREIQIKTAIGCAILIVLALLGAIQEMLWPGCQIFID